MLTSLTAESNLTAMFSAKAVMRGGVIRRNVSWANDQIGRERLVAEVLRRGFHMVQCGEQYVVICNGGHMKMIC